MGLNIRLKIKILIRFTLVLTILAIFSVLLHEFVHVVQFHYFYGIPFNALELHFFWEFDSSNLSLTETLANFPIAWISYKTQYPITDKESMILEIYAYGIQYIFLFGFYIKFMYKNEKFMWRG